MNIAIVGGTGMLGSRVAGELRRRGHEVRVLSRRAAEFRIDLTTGEGLLAALQGCDAVIDASNGTSKAQEVLVGGTRRLLEAGKAAGVRHHICVSIVGCDKLPIGYYRAKVSQERLVERGSVPWTIVRATQFHEFVVSLFAQAGKWGVLPVPRAQLQTIAAADAANAVADSVEEGPLLRRYNVAGPERTDSADLARVWRTITGRKTLLLPITLPGELGRALQAGYATPDDPDAYGTITFEQCLQEMKI